ncbi:hypothetical protein NBRC10512v2_004440 [Rhodotorula toruloides]
MSSIDTEKRLSPPAPRPTGNSTRPPSADSTGQSCPSAPSCTSSTSSSARSNIGNAKVAGLAKDLHLTPHQYLVALTCTYVLYIVFELPSNLLLKKVGAHFMLPGMVTLWGICCCMTGFVQNYGGLVAARLILGMLEGGVFPGLVLYLSSFYRRHELQTRISLFFSAASLSGAFSGLLAAAIINLDGKGGQEGWRWIFFLEGGFTALFGILLFFLLPGSPSTSRFLTADQKAHIERRLKLDSPAGTTDFEEAFSWREVRKAATMFLKSLSTAVRYVSLFLAITSVYSTAPALVTWLPNNSAGHYRKATAVALGFIMTNSGGIASTWLFPTNEGPRYYKATSVLISMTLVVALFAFLNLLYLRRENAKKAELREANGGEVDAESWREKGDRHEHFVYSM